MGLIDSLRDRFEQARIERLTGGYPSLEEWAESKCALTARIADAKGNRTPVLMTAAELAAERSLADAARIRLEVEPAGDGRVAVGYYRR